MTFKPVIVGTIQVRNKIKILAIDDNLDVLHLLEEWLSEYDFEVIMAESATEGLERAMSAPPDVVLTDVLMPDMDGIQLIHQLRKSFPDLWIVAMSGGGIILPAVTALNLSQAIGANRILNKPLRKLDLLAAICDHVNQDPVHQ